MKTLYSLFIAPLFTFFVVSNNIESTESSPTTPTIRQTPPPEFSFFRTHRQGRGITSTWGMTNNSGINCFVVERTYEDPYDEYAVWDMICTQPNNNSRSYKTTDDNVLPGYVTYRVTAHMNGGGTIVSQFSTEHIVAH